MAVSFVPGVDVSNMCTHLSLQNRSHCIAMQTRRNHQGRFSGAGQGKVLEPQDRAEGPCGGAAKEYVMVNAATELTSSSQNCEWPLQPNLMLYQQSTDAAEDGFQVRG